MTEEDVEALMVYTSGKGDPKAVREIINRANPRLLLFALLTMLRARADQPSKLGKRIEQLEDSEARLKQRIERLSAHCASLETKTQKLARGVGLGQP